MRIQSRTARRARHFRLLLEPGKDLFSGLVEPLQRLGVKSASTTILGGRFSRLSYCTAPPDPLKQAIVSYEAPILLADAQMIFGNATVATGLDGSPLVHCHAAIQPADKAPQGGHVIAQFSIVGDAPITVLVTSLDGFELRVEFDAETNIPLIQPTTGATP